jgi:hypothetical protein
MPSPTPHPDMTLVIRNVQSLPHHLNQQSRGPSGCSRLPPAKRRISIPAGKRGSFQGGFTVASIIQGKDSILSSSLNNSRIADINRRLTYTLSASKPRSINTPTDTGVPAFIALQHTAEPQRGLLYPAPHPALLSLPLISAVLKTGLPPSLSQKPA